MIKKSDPSHSATYAEAGVDIGAGDALVERIKPFANMTARAGTTAALGGFGGLFDLKAAGYVDPILVASNDGVGTKVKIAIETGLHHGIGIDLVAMCVNDVAVQGAQPLFFLDYFACGKLNLAVAEAVVKGVADGCVQAACALIGGETAEMPGLYAAGDYDLAGFCVGAAERGALLPRHDIAAGDVVIGVASSGVHSNGFSLVRKIVSDGGFGWVDPAPFDTGSAAQTLGDALLTPTRIYVKAAMALHSARLAKAFAHITGGGLPGNMPRVLPDGLAARINLSAWRPDPVFRWLAQDGRVSQAEMLKTFNCGIGFVVVTAPDHAEQAIHSLIAFGEQAFVIGCLEPRANGEPVRFEGALDLRL